MPGLSKSTLPYRGTDTNVSEPVCLLLTTDLIFATKVTGTAALLGGEVVVVADAPQTLQLCRQRRPACVLIDLSAVREVAMTVGAIAEATDASLVAFGAHVDRERLEAARQAGCQVMPRSGFARQLPAILRQHFAAPASPSEASSQPQNDRP